MTESRAELRRIGRPGERFVTEPDLDESYRGKVESAT
jgi:hypothetical protein